MRNPVDTFHYPSPGCGFQPVHRLVGGLDLAYADQYVPAAPPRCVLLALVVLWWT